MSRDLWVGKQFGSYVLQRALGHGTLGRTYLGYSAELDIQAAVKVLLPGPERQAKDLERLLPQAHSLLRLRHPCIVSLRDVGRNGDPYLVMEYVDGLDLRRVLERLTASGERIPTSDVLQIVADVAEAIDCAHRGGVLHGDLKPSNVLVDGKGRASVCDFAVAAALRTGMQDWGPDSLRYAAPESAISSQGAVPQSDVYSLGVILYEMCTGHVPFDDPYPPTIVIQHIRLPVPSPRLSNPAVSPAVESVVLRALEKEPSARYPTGSALAAALQQAIEASGAESAEPAGRPDQPTVDGAARAGGEGPDGSAGMARLVRESLAHAPRPPQRSSAVRPHRPVLRGRWAALPWAGLGSCFLALCLFAFIGLGSAGIFGSGEETETTASASEGRRNPSPAASELAPQADPSGGPIPLPTLPAAPNVVMVYDDSSVAVVNMSAATLSLAGVQFVRIAPDGASNAAFDPVAWNTVAARHIRALPASDCYMLLRLNQRVSPPDPCQDLWGWLATSNSDWYFWTLSQGSLYFGVLHYGRTLHICPIADGRCTFFVPQP